MVVSPDDSLGDHGAAGVDNTALAGLSTYIDSNNKVLINIFHIHLF